MFRVNFTTPLGMGALLLVATSALADMPPPPDYQEACTRELAEEAGEYCQLVSGYYADPNGCLEQQIDGLSNAPADPAVCTSYGALPTEADCCQIWLDSGYTFRCKTYGASAFQAMWCRARQDGDPEPPPAVESASDDDEGCSVADAGRTGLPVVALLLAFGALGALARIRRRRR